ncbi:N-acetylmuramic acid 6-phosphate etherase, partial [Streptomyces sp. SID5475]|nr:N-acetylmuramic acid 6-phosphate etherase [Streptomyces sp. SID5475]
MPPTPAPEPSPAPGRPSEDLRAQLDTLATEAFRGELAGIDRLSTREIAEIMNREDAGV